MKLSPAAPRDIDTERIVLGSMLATDVAAIDACVEQMAETDFYPQKHRDIFRAILALYYKRQPVDIVTVSDLLKKNGLLDKIGGNAYLSELISDVPASHYIDHHIGVLRDAAKLRALIAVSQHALSIAQSGKMNGAEAINWAQREIYNLAIERTDEERYAVLGAVVDSVMADIKKYSRGRMLGVSTGFKDLDRLTAGLHHGELTILAARPSMGKTSLATAIAVNLCKQQKYVLFFSLETGKSQLVMRMLCADAEVSMHMARMGRLTSYEEQHLRDSGDAMLNYPLCISDSFNTTPMKMAAQARRFVKDYGQLDLVIVDYIQLMQPTHYESRRERAVASIGREIKGIAHEMQVPIIALGQMNREIERVDRKPKLSDLRESGALEQDADNVWFIHHDEDFDRDATETTAVIVISKNRNGPCGDVLVSVRPRNMQWQDKEEDGFDASSTGEYVPHWSD